jgi:hypothetical protein
MTFRVKTVPAPAARYPGTQPSEAVDVKRSLASITVGVGLDAHLH